MKGRSSKDRTSARCRSHSRRNHTEPERPRRIGRPCRGTHLRTGYGFGNRSRVKVRNCATAPSVSKCHFTGHHLENPGRSTVCTVDVPAFDEMSLRSTARPANPAVITSRQAEHLPRNCRHQIDTLEPRDSGMGTRWRIGVFTAVIATSLWRNCETRFTANSVPVTLCTKRPMRSSSHWIVGVSSFWRPLPCGPRNTSRSSGSRSCSNPGLTDNFTDVHVTDDRSG